MFRYCLVVIPALITLTACGGGGGGGNAMVAGPGSSGGWQAGVFMDAATFFGRCDAPRTGTNPATGNAFADVQGTITDENNFLRSYSDDTYLWYDEITDRDPALYDDPLDYFDLLRTEEVTASGAAKDKFHFTFDSAEYFQLSQSGVSSGYGATFVLLSSTPPREAVVAYVEPSSPATQVLLARGTRILEIDNVDINDATNAGVDVLNAGLFPSNAGESHEFVVQDIGSATTRTVTMVSATITSEPVQNVMVIDDPNLGKVGYLAFNDHIATAEEGLVNAVNQLAASGIDELVVDLRYNGGGFLSIASQFAYMIAGDGPTAGQTFEQLQFNDKHPSTNPVTGNPVSPTPFYDETRGLSLSAGQALPSLNMSRVAVLTGPGTCSASEAIMNGLRGVGVEVIQVGATTCGKPYGFYATDNCGTTYFTIQFRGVNAANFGDYTDGFSPANVGATAGTVVPGCAVADDFSKPLGDPSETRLSVALGYLTTQTCPSPTATVRIEGEPSDLSAVDGVVLKSLWLQNRIVSDL